MQMQKGANAPLDGSKVDLSWTAEPTGGAIDISAYLLDQSGKVLGDEGMVFWGQAEVPGLSLASGAKTASFSLALDALPSAIEKIAICAVVDTANAPSARLADARHISMRMGALSFEIDLSSMTEQALIIGEIYKRNDQWKLRAVSQGFNGGLAAISTHFGVEIAGEAPPPSMTQSNAVPPPPAAPAPPSAPVSIKKVTLSKSEKVSLRKGQGSIRALLSWEGRGGGDGDLDFYCFYVLNDGTTGKVYWKDLGSVEKAPYIRHSGDALRAGEEAIVIERPDLLRYALFAAYSAVKNGAGSFKSYRPRMTLTDASGSEVTIPLENPSASSYWVAITHLDCTQDVQIEHVETYGKNGFPHMIAAERAPRLHPDGSWDVSKGEIEFKK